MNTDSTSRLRSVYGETKMTGWDFSVLDGRLTADEPWWDFEADCLSAMRARLHGRSVLAGAS